jgi:hypothetical protein
MRMRFIGVVKKATKQYLMAYLSNIDLHERSDRRGLRQEILTEHHGCWYLSGWIVIEDIS